MSWEVGREDGEKEGREGQTKNFIDHLMCDDPIILLTIPRGRLYYFHCKLRVVKSPESPRNETTPKPRSAWLWKSCTCHWTTLPQVLGGILESAMVCFRCFFFLWFWVPSLKCLGVSPGAQILSCLIPVHMSLPVPYTHFLSFSIFSFPCSLWNAQSGDCEVPWMDYPSS